MKKILFALLFLPFFALAEIGVPPDVMKALTAGDAATLSRFFDETVEVSVLGQENIYSKAQAIEVVKNFFAKNHPKTFSQVHQGASKGKDSQYCIGDLTTTGGASFRVYIYFKAVGDASVIQELRFDSPQK